MSSIGFRTSNISLDSDQAVFDSTQARAADQKVDNGPKRLYDGLLTEHALFGETIISCDLRSIDCSSMERMKDLQVLIETVPQLSYLNLSTCQLGNQVGMLSESLMTNTSIATLNLAANQITLAGAKSLRFNRHIKRLYLQNNPFGLEGIRVILKQVFSESPQMHTLSLRHTNCWCKGKHLSNEFFQKDNNNEPLDNQLDLAYNELAESEFGALCESLTANRQFQAIDFSNNHLTPRFLKNILKVMGCTPCVRYISSFTHFLRAPSQGIFWEKDKIVKLDELDGLSPQLLAPIQHLTTLDLTGCTKEFQRLASLLDFSRFKTIILNQLTRDTPQSPAHLPAEQLASVIKSSAPSIRKIELYNNRFSSQDLAVIVQSLLTCQKLECTGFTIEFFDHHVIEDMITFIQNNPHLIVKIERVTQHGFAAGTLEKRPYSSKVFLGFLNQYFRRLQKLHFHQRRAIMQLSIGLGLVARRRESVLGELPNELLAVIVRECAQLIHMSDQDIIRAEDYVNRIVNWFESDKTPSSLFKPLQTDKQLEISSKTIDERQKLVNLARKNVVHYLDLNRRELYVNFETKRKSTRKGKYRKIMKMGN